MRMIIAAMQISADGYIEGPGGTQDWVENWEESYGLAPLVDTCLLGGGMYPGYAQYWRSILKDPKGVLPFSGKVATKGEVAFAHFADKTPHIVLSRTMDRAAWENTRIVRDIEEIRRMKEHPGKAMYAVGGGMLVRSLIEAGLLDELRLIVHPIVLGGGKALFDGVEERHSLTLLETKPLEAGNVYLSYGLQS